MRTTSICYECLHCSKIDGKYDAPMEECYTEEDWCELGMENYGTPEGCYQYERD